VLSEMSPPFSEVPGERELPSPEKVRLVLPDTAAWLGVVPR
jgi:hypothetical protein